MTREQKLELLREWESKVRISRQKMIALSETIKNEHLDPFAEIEIAYTKSIARIVGDSDDWLDWYSTENELGDAGLTWQMPNGEMINKNSIERLLDAIETEL